MTASGDGPSSSQSGQVGFADLSDSGIKFEIDALVEHSDQNLSSVFHVLDRVHNTGKGHALQATGSNQSNVDQNHINTKILAQVSALGARLDNMESSIKSGNKTNDGTKIKRSRVKTKGSVAHAGFFFFFFWYKFPLLLPLELAITLTCRYTHPGKEVFQL